MSPRSANRKPFTNVARDLAGGAGNYTVVAVQHACIYGYTSACYLSSVQRRCPLSAVPSIDPNSTRSPHLLRTVGLGSSFLKKILTPPPTLTITDVCRKLVKKKHVTPSIEPFVFFSRNFIRPEYDS